MTQNVYMVEGTTTSGPLAALEVESFVCNVCAISKGHAAEIVDVTMRERGYRGTVVSKITALPGGCGLYAIGQMLRIH